MENVNIAEGGTVERREFLAAIYAAGYIEPGVGTGGGGEGADEAECLVEAAVGVLVSSILWFDPFGELLGSFLFWKF